MPSTRRRAHLTSRPARLARRRGVWALTAAAALALSGCAGSAAGTGSAPASGPNAGAAGTHTRSSGDETVTVLAAASLTEAFGAIARQVEHDHPGTTVEVSFAASSTIVQQVNEGAPADVIALAGQEALKPLDRSLLATGSTRVFAGNSLEIATPPSNPAHITSLSDLAQPSVDVVLCAAQVPCGDAAKATLAKAGVTAHVVSYERDVKAALAKVELGEADAAIVYRSDVATAGGRVHGVPIPGTVNEVLHYPIARLDDSPGARAFVAAVLSPKGQQRLHADGFQSP